MTCTDLDLSWKVYFSDPLPFWVNTKSKRGSRHRYIWQSLWIDGLRKHFWVKEVKTRRKVDNWCKAMCEQDSFQDHTALCDLIKACGKQKDLLKGSRIHADLLNRGLLKKHIYLGNALLSMYAKCGALRRAREVFDELPERNVVTWNSLITGYVQSGLGDEALSCFELMRDEGLSPNAVTFACILKACGIIGAGKKGEEIHVEVRNQGLLKKDLVLGNALVDMYVKFGALKKAQEVFDELPTRDIFTWNTLINGYAQHGLGDKALSSFKQMRSQGLHPDTVTFICILKACGSIRVGEKGEKIHAEVHKQGLLEKDIVLGSALVDMYVKCGMLAKAQHVFDELPAYDVVTWTALMAGYADHGLGNEVLSYFKQMQEEGLSPNAVTFACTLKACGSIGSGQKGEEIHTEILRQGLLENNIVLVNALVDMLVKCGSLAKAQEVFDELPAQDIVTWNVLIAGYAERGFGNEALSCFKQMRDQGLFPDTTTFISILKACGSIGAVDKGNEIHAEVLRERLLEKDIALCTAVVDMYVKCGTLAKAQEVFDKLPVRDVVTWNALIAGYAGQGLGNEALNCFARMCNQGLYPDTVTYICILKACGSIRAGEEGEKIHADACSRGLLGNDIAVGNALVDMYAKCGALGKAEELFDDLPARDIVTWNALISGYAQHGLGDAALTCSKRMRDEGLPQNAVTFICILKACSSIGAGEKGEEIYAEVVNQGLLENEIELGTALVDMYVKCGALAKAQEVFDKLPERNVVTWNALLTGYAQLGEIRRAVNLFNKIVGEGLEADSVTFLVLMMGCSHAGLVAEGEMYFDIMSTIYCIIPTLEHHTCMVDLFGRAGHFDKALSTIVKVPPSDRFGLWLAVMGACQKWAYVQLGRCAFEHVIQLREKFPAAYVCMSNIYAAGGMQGEADKIEALRMKNGAWRIPGRCWWTDVSGNIHSFSVGDKSHPQRRFINAKLRDIGQTLQLEGYSSQLHWVSQTFTDSGKEHVLCGHNQKLAIACALINTLEGASIRVRKNMRMCGDCHVATLLVSKMEKRRIQLTDSNRIHVFEDGKCICENYGDDLRTE